MEALLNCCGDIEINPGSRQSSLTFFHWNLNGIASHDFIKTSLLHGYIIDCNFGIICLSETFLKSSFNREDDKLKIEGYNLIRSDNPSALKKGGECIYYNEHIPFIRRNDLCSLCNCLVTVTRLENEKCSLTCLYQSTSQNLHEFANSCTNLDTLMDNINDELPTCSILAGDFNGRCSKWCNNDITNANGRALNTLTSSATYKQIMNKLNHTVNRSYVLQ